LQSDGKPWAALGPPRSSWQSCGHTTSGESLASAARILRGRSGWNTQGEEKRKKEQEIQQAAPVRRARHPAPRRAEQQERCGCQNAECARTTANRRNRACRLGFWFYVGFRGVQIWKMRRRHNCLKRIERLSESNRQPEPWQICRERVIKDLRGSRRLSSV